MDHKGCLLTETPCRNKLWSVSWPIPSVGSSPMHLCFFTRIAPHTKEAPAQWSRGEMANLATDEQRALNYRESHRSRKTKQTLTSTLHQELHSDAASLPKCCYTHLEISNHQSYLMGLSRILLAIATDSGL
jgi:hypothetical protein